MAARLAVVFALAGALAGCFQPLYAERSTVGGPALVEKFHEVEILQIQGRLGDELRNELIFLLTGGAGNPKNTPLKMVISVSSGFSSAIVDTSSGLPESGIVRVAANWYIYRSEDEKKKPIAQGQASGSASVDLSSQRFANYSAKNDAEARAARMAAEQIKIQLGAYFLRISGS